MIGILILIGIVVAFNKAAKSRNLSGVLYGILSIVMWFLFQILAALLKVYIDPYSTEMELLAWGLGGSLAGIGILYAIMIYAAKNKVVKIKTNDDIMDDTSIDEL